MIIDNKLYRGITLNCDELDLIQFGDKDIMMHYEPIIDDNGNKTVKDGNEYGIYMSDNKTMVDDVYGKPHKMGKPISRDLYIGNPSEHKMISYPIIALSYEIDASKTQNLRKPRIASVLEGHYNNGFEGDEWICDKIPAGSYKLYRIIIGNDLLHESQVIDINNKSKEEVINDIISVIKSRVQDLQTLIEFYEKIPKAKKLVFNIDLYKDMFFCLKYEEDNNRRKLMRLDNEVNGYGTEIQNFLFLLRNKIDNESDLGHFIKLKISDIDKRISDLQTSSGDQMTINRFLTLREKYIFLLNNLESINQNSCSESQPGNE